MLHSIVAKLADMYLIRRYSIHIKLLLMVYPFFVVLYFNHFLAAFAAFGVHLFISSLLIRFIDDQTGISMYQKKISDIEGMRRFDVIKMGVMIFVSIPSILIFIHIDPIKIIYISGLS